jgi:hypothetical protein
MSGTVRMRICKVKAGMYTIVIGALGECLSICL